MKVIKDFPTPKKIKQVRAFLGLCNFYRRFIPEYSLHIRPLCDLLKKEKSWTWGAKEQEAFEQIKSLFIETIELQHPDTHKEYYLQTDSSGVGISGVLYQMGEDGEQRILGFHSKAIKGAQLNWTVTEQEFYSVICCLEKFETYLRGAKVIIRTDHKALIFVKNWKLFNARDARWVNYLEQFHYDIQHVKGSENVVADILSRYLPKGELLQEDKVKLPEISYMGITPNKELNMKLNDISRIQNEDKETRDIIDQITNRKENLSKIAERCSVENNILYYTTGGNLAKVIYLPEQLRQDLIRQVHLEMGHQGAYKVIKYIRYRFFWKGLTRQVRLWVRTCPSCQLTKHNTSNLVGPCRSIVTKEIGELVMADLYGPLPTGKFGMNYILVIQDSFSKFVKLYDLKKATALSVLCKGKKFMNIINPKAIMTDNGSPFASRLWKDFMEKAGVRTIYTTVRNPRPNTTD